jgi:hypothetical protein
MTPVVRPRCAHGQEISGFRLWAVLSVVIAWSICPRINRETCGLKKWIQVALNASRFLSHAVEGVVELGHKFLFRGVVSVVRCLDPHIVPKRFDGVELRTILGERTKMKPMAVITEPFPDLRSTMVGRVVVDEEHLLPRVALGQAPEKGGVALAFEDIPVAVIEPGTIQIDRSEDLLGVPLPGRRDQRLMAPAGPGLIETGILTEAGFVGIEQRRIPISGFFLGGDRCSVANGPARPDRPWPAFVGDVARKSPST